MDATPTDALGLRAVTPFTNGASLSPPPNGGAPRPEWAGGADTAVHSAESRHLPNTKAPHALSVAAAVGQPKAEAAMALAVGDPDIRAPRGQLSGGDRLSRRPSDRSLTAPAASQKTDPVNGGPALPDGEPDTEDLLSEVDDSATDGQHISDVRRSETGAANRATHASPSAREVATQVVAAAVRTSSDGDFTEITLDPEDLGKVKIKLRTEGGHAYLVVAAERQDVAELMRRNLAILEQEFRNQGFGSVSLSFEQRGHETGGRNADAGHGPGAPGESGATAAADADPFPVPSGRRVASANGGLDMRV
jgi:hypothetical protein